MAKYYVEVKGSGKTISRTGTADSGMWSHTRGWNIGVDVYIHLPTRPNASPDEDIVEIYLTGGSNNTRTKKFLGRFTRKDLEGY